VPPTIATPVPLDPSIIIPLDEPASRDPSHLTLPDPKVQFVRGILTTGDLTLAEPTSLALGPDGRLYVGQLDGRVVALTLEGQTVTAVELIAPAGILGNVLGLAFNPTDPPEPIILYVSHTQLYGKEGGPPYAGKISLLRGPAFRLTDIITGLPVSSEEHGTNDIVFGDDGTLYIAQGGTTNAGVPSERFPRPETPLSGAILVADLWDPTFDGRVLYEPSDEASDTVDQTAGDVRVYASGFRNVFDLVLHSNGRIYATDNGPNPGDGAQSLDCATNGLDPVAPDELNLIAEGAYYGHPNRSRGRMDERQCTYRAADDNLGGTMPPLATLGIFTSANGIAEYSSNAFGGRLRGSLVYVEWAKGRVWRVKLTGDGTGVESVSQLVADALDRPLDVVVGPDGTVYAAEMGADQVTYFQPARQ
jgi:glucose/arabinose dehydrogenase